MAACLTSMLLFLLFEMNTLCAIVWLNCSIFMYNQKTMYTHKPTRTLCLLFEMWLLRIILLNCPEENMLPLYYFDCVEFALLSKVVACLIWGHQSTPQLHLLLLLLLAAVFCSCCCCCWPQHHLGDANATYSIQYLLLIAFATWGL